MNGQSSQMSDSDPSQTDERAGVHSRGHESPPSPGALEPGAHAATRGPGDDAVAVTAPAHRSYAGGIPVIGRPHGAARIIGIDAQRDPRWEQFVASHPDGSIYYHPTWLRSLEREYGQRVICLACEDARGQLRGILPLLHTRGLPFPAGGGITARRLSSLPRTPIAGPLAVDQEATAALVCAAADRVRREPGTRLQLKVPAARIDGLVEGVSGVPWRQTYVLELPDRPDKIRFGNSRNHARIKWAVNKATRLGVQVRAATEERELRAWYDLYLETQRWHAIPPRPYRLFKSCWELMRPHGLMRLLLAEQQTSTGTRLLAGSIFLMYGRTVFYAFNGRHRDDLALRPNDAIQWQAIRDACRDGYRRFDFGEVAEDRQGLAGFKSKWGAEASWLHHYYYPALREQRPHSLEPAGYVHQLASATWRRLPLTATMLLGDMFYHFL